MFADVNADTPNPVMIALRSQMKGEFLNTFSRNDQSLKDWKDAEVVIYGSTLMRQLAYNEGVDFPLEGFKSSDIDIGVIEKKGHSQDFSDKILTQLAPVIRKAVADSGFSYFAEQQGYAKKEVRADTPEEVEKLPGSAFVGDFFVTKTFTPEEVHERLKSRPDYEELKPYIASEPMEVKLVIGANDKPFPVLMNSRDTLPESKEGSFKRTRAYDMLAGKIVRSMTDKYKPTDFIDIYNLIKATNKSDGSPHIDLDPNSPNNELDSLRVLIVGYMPMSRGIYPDRENLLSAFENTPEKKARFLERIEGQIAANKMPELRASVDDIFETINTTLHTIMDKRPGLGAHGPLNLTDKEKLFFDKTDGYVDAQKEIAAEKPAVKILGMQFRSKKPAQTVTERKPTTAEIDVSLLKAEHPDAFKKHPELAYNLENNGILQSKIMESRYGATSGVSEIPLDF